MNYYDIYVLSVEGFDRTEAVYLTKEILFSEGGSIDEECLLILGDTPTIEPDSEIIINAENAIQRLVEWETLGSITFMMPEVLITVTFHISIKNPSKVGCIEIAVPANSVDSRGETAKNKYLSISNKLHSSLDADRTIMGLGINRNGFSWQKETEQINKGIFAGNYLLDLKKET